MTSIQKWGGGPGAAEGSPAYRETNSAFLSIKHPGLQVKMVCLQMEMNKKLINVSGLGLGFRGDRKVRWALQNAGEGQLGADIIGENKSSMCRMQLKGMWWSQVHLPVEMCPQEKTCWRGWQPCCIFSQDKKALSRLLRGLYFSPPNLVPPDEDWGTVAWVNSPVATVFWGC